MSASLPPGAVSAPAVIAGARTGYDGTFTLTSVTPLGLYTITGVSEVGTKVTATVTGTFPAALVNTTVVISGVPTANYNGSFTVTAVTPGPTTSTFTYTDTHGGLATGSALAATATVNLSTLTYADTTTGLAAGKGGTATVNLGAAGPSNSCSYRCSGLAVVYARREWL